MDTAQLGKRIGQAISVRRLACGLTQEEVAERLGRGVVMPTVSRLVELAEMFGCLAADLMAEVSGGARDQGQRMTQALSKLDERDRVVLADVVERLAECLGRH